MVGFDHLRKKGATKYLYSLKNNLKKKKINILVIELNFYAQFVIIIFFYFFFIKMKICFGSVVTKNCTDRQFLAVDP